jgi:hypothetical protein
MDKSTALQQLEDGFGELLKAVEGLDDRTATRVFYGTWSVKDILAHMSGWHHQMSGAMERMARGEKPTPEGVDYSDSDGWNARFAAAMAPQNTSTVIADLKQSFATYLRAAKAIPDDRFGEGKTINRLIEGSGYGHYREHLPEIQKFRAGGADFDPGP